MRRFPVLLLASSGLTSRLPRVASALLLGLICALFVQAIFLLGWLDGWERGTLDTLFRARGQRFGTPEIVLIVADDATVARYNAWPLPRRLHAQVVRRLHHAGARTIAFDLLFSSPSERPVDDDEFIAACRKAGNTIHACAFHVEGVYNPSLPVSANDTGQKGNKNGSSEAFATRYALPDNASTGALTEALPSAIWFSAPQSDLREAAAFLGHINVYPGRDGALRRIPHLIAHRGRLYPSLALAAATHYLGASPQRLQARTDAIIIPTRDAHTARRIPFNSDGETWINWTGGYRTFPTYSIADLLGGQVPDEVFKDRIVLIGATAAGSFEYRATPFSHAQPALELQANALDNILTGRHLQIAPGWIRFALLIFSALVCGALIAPRLDVGGTLLLITLSALLWLLALWLLWRHDFYLPVAAPILAAVLTYAFVMATNYREEWEANFRTDAAVSALARGGALMASDHDRAHLQQVIRNSAREALRAREVIFVSSEEPDELLQGIARHLYSRRRAALWPARSKLATEKPFAPDAELASLLQTLARREGTPPLTVVAAPLLHKAMLGAADNGDAEEIAAGVRRKTGGVLIAIGQTEGRAFSFRDAILLETLCEQAVLALENLEYSQLLQGRIELANRDLREAYNVLTEQSAKFMAAVESINDALVICDAEGKAVFVNGGAQPTLLEATPQLGQSVPEVLAAHGLEPIAALFDCLSLRHHGLEDCNPARGEAILCSNRNAGSETGELSESSGRTLSAQLTPLLFDDGQPIGAMLLVADVTAQRELDQMKTDFVSFVAHELRSPLGAILGYSSLLEQYSERTDPVQRSEMASAIIRQCHRLNRLIGDLLDISRLESGHPIEMRREKVDLRSLAERVLDASRAALTNPNISLRLSCAEPVISVWGDPDRLEQILLNLISNAVKYSPEGGEILVSLETDDDRAMLRVRDPGIGLTPEQISNLFQKYYRASGARERGIKGTGLGLFLVKNLVEAHGGQISVQSKPKRGTTFIVSLPQRASGTPSLAPISDKMLIAP